MLTIKGCRSSRGGRHKATDVGGDSTTSSGVRSVPTLGSSSSYKSPASQAETTSDAQEDNAEDQDYLRLVADVVVGDEDPILLQRRLHENSLMDPASDIDTGASEDNRILIVGDFLNFLIVDRIGSTVEFVPHLMGSNQRPSGERGLLLWFRTGSDSLVDNSFRMLNVVTTA